MIVKIEIDDNISDDEILIKCKEITEGIKRIQKIASDSAKQADIHFYKDNTEYYLTLDSVLFFETSGTSIHAHTNDNFYEVKNKLYELENTLPSNFVRVSKLTIINVNHIYSIEKNITSSSSVQFNDTHKQIYVSRNYYKVLKQRIDQHRNLN